MSGVDQWTTQSDSGREVAGGTVPSVGGLSLAVSAGLLTWRLIGRHDTGDYYLFGPFDPPSWVEPVVVAVGVGLLVLAVAVPAIPALRRGPHLSIWTVALLTADAAVAGFAWRVLTDGVVGANIGGGLLLLFGPGLSAVLLVGAVLIETARRGYSGRRTLAWVAGTVLASAGLQVALWLAAN